MAIQATVRRFGHSSGEDWWSDVAQAWVEEANATPVTLEEVSGMPGIYAGELVPRGARGDEHTYVAAVTDTADPTLRDIIFMYVDASPSPDAIVEWTEQGDHGPTQAVRALYESPAAAAAASPPYADADKVESVTIEYDEGTGRRSRYKQIES